MGYVRRARRQVLGEAADYAKASVVTLSIENERRPIYASSRRTGRVHEEVWLWRHHRRGAHALTLRAARHNLHVNDNDGDRDAHLCPGDGIMGLSLLRLYDRMIIDSIGVHPFYSWLTLFIFTLFGSAFKPKSLLLIMISHYIK